VAGSVFLVEEVTAVHQERLNAENVLQAHTHPKSLVIARERVQGSTNIPGVNHRSLFVRKIIFAMKKK